MTTWNKSSWKNKTALQQPEWPAQELHEANKQLSHLPPLVAAGEIRDLKAHLAKAAKGQAFLLQGGDCSEEFARCTAPNIKSTLKVLLQMAAILTYGGGRPVIKVGRMAGQYAKPRSSPTEMVNGVELPSYRGDMCNSVDGTPEARKADPQRMLKGYYLSAATLNLLRAFAQGGFSSLHNVHKWNQEFVKNSPVGGSYEQSVARQIERTLTFMENIGIHTDMPQIKEVEFFTSHEALFLDYEESLAREDSEDEVPGRWYDCSGHMLWIGDRTRQLEGAHVEFLRGVRNPLGMKVGPGHNPEEIVKVIQRLNPDNEEGRMTLITRFGAGKVEQYLPPLIRAVQGEGLNVLWCCDPMHGNIRKALSGCKTRSFEDILAELKSFFAVCGSEGAIPGGVHFELTGKDEQTGDVTECTGGASGLSDEGLRRNYCTACDPRLNAEQSLEMAFRIAEMLKES
uniref:class II 3-deoxy-7-phosphoheptulonate synthase n=1 Tax=Candidatus Electronema sp. TaxID=2698783 RepID=UPI00405610C9